MKVFISWSGDRSRAIAQALHSWLPSVLQTVETWISDEDINKGARWAAKLAAELEQTQVGILCLTPENLNSAWLIFEAGALSKTQQDTYVCTFLYELTETDFQGPLSQFQSTKAQKEDIKKLVLDINKFQKERSISERQVDIAFERGWHELEQLLNNVSTIQAQKKTRRPIEDMIEEILELARSQARGGRTYVPPVSRQLVTGRILSSEDILRLVQYWGMLPDEIEKTAFSNEVLTLLKDIKESELRISNATRVRLKPLSGLGMAAQSKDVNDENSDS
jgi:hypothetical protein